MLLQSINPYTNNLIEEFEVFSDKKIDKRVSKFGNRFK